VASHGNVDSSPSNLSVYITPESVELVKGCSLLSLLRSENIYYKKSGHDEYETICPWHSDTNPSLTVSSSKNFCYCFACSGGGDIIAYVRQKYNLLFSDAVKKIADIFNVEIKYQSDPKSEEYQSRRRSAIRQLQDEQSLYRQVICNEAGEPARRFLAERGILASTCKEFQLGYSADERRVKIPIFDHDNTLVGFSGRTINGSMPKYKNSKNSEIFNKSRLIFNENRATANTRDSGSIVFVEGFFDVMTLYQSGLRNVVAMMGVGAPDYWAIKRIASKVNRFILCYDSDDGGIRAIDHFMRPARKLCFSGEISVNVVTLPAGEDPDSMARKDIQSFRDLLKSSVPWFDWQIKRKLDIMDRVDSSSYTKIEKELKTMIGEICSSSLRMHYLDKVSKALTDSNEHAVTIVEEWEEVFAKNPSTVNWVPRGVHQLRKKSEMDLLSFYIRYPDTREELREYIKFIKTPSCSWLADRIMELEYYGMMTYQAVLWVIVYSEHNHRHDLMPIIKPKMVIEPSPGIINCIKERLSTAQSSVV
jgi:DNA primase